MATAAYYVKDANDALYRRRDGAPDALPDEVLHPGGWVPLIGQLTVSPNAYPKPSRRGSADGGADPSLLLRLSRASEDEARGMASGRGLPLEGW